ncbi:MAG: DUF5411 family protein [bacterium]|nr:DUF5411 family protein [bacterium]
MSKAMLVVGIFILGALALAMINVIEDMQAGNDLDYYLLEETTEAAMIDAIDIGYYRLSGGVLRIDREKFLESFIRRFAQSVNRDKDYDIQIIDLNETPPKVSIKVDSKTIASFNGEQLGIENKVDAILETKYEENRLLRQVQ